MQHKFDVIIIGAGFTGLSAARRLLRQGKSVCLIESDSAPGGLAGEFNFNDGISVEKFYHHWFQSDTYVIDLIKQLDLEKNIARIPANTGMFLNGRPWKFSSPRDLLKFTPLSFFNRLRLGLLIFRVRLIKNWHSIEKLSIREWLEPLCGSTTYNIVWKPLINAKFSNYADEISAVWMWKKLVLRGGTRDKAGREELLYYKGGFGSLATELASRIEGEGGKILYNSQVVELVMKDNKIESAVLGDKTYVQGNKFLCTTPLPVLKTMLKVKHHENWLKSISKIKYLGNICLVLRLKKSLSDTYWLNVNDPGFPFVGVIEHTNFDSPENYGNTRIVYLSRYLTVTDPLWSDSDEDYLLYCLRHLKRMFPKFERSWVVEYGVWKSEHAQPIITKNYSELRPDHKTPINNLWLASMAQIYPEDRGTNYAIRDGEKVAELILKEN
jgi:protoporphyrinogen oxidase